MLDGEELGSVKSFDLNSNIEIHKSIQKLMLKHKD